METNNIAKSCFDIATRGQKEGGKPKENWRQTVDKEGNQLGHRIWIEAKR